MRDQKGRSGDQKEKESSTQRSGTNKLIKGENITSVGKRRTTEEEKVKQT